MRVEIELNNYGIKRIRQGNPLIQQDDLKQDIKKIPLEWVKFVDNKHKYIATGYLGETKQRLWLGVRSNTTPNQQSFSNGKIPAGN